MISSAWILIDSAVRKAANEFRSSQECKELDKQRLTAELKLTDTAENSIEVPASHTAATLEHKTDNQRNRRKRWKQERKKEEEEERKRQMQKEAEEKKASQAHLAKVTITENNRLPFFPDDIPQDDTVLEYG